MRDWKSYLSKVNFHPSRKTGTVSENAPPLERGRYRRQGGQVIVDVAVRNLRQLFNE